MNSDQNPQKTGKLRSKITAARLYNNLISFFVRTRTPEIEQKLINLPFKTMVFRDFFLQKANPQEIIILAEFLEQGEYAEEVLQDVWR